MEKAEEQLTGLLGDANLVACLRHLLREPASLEAAAAAATAELRSSGVSSPASVGTPRPHTFDKGAHSLTTTAWAERVPPYPPAQPSGPVHAPPPACPSLSRQDVHAEVALALEDFRENMVGAEVASAIREEMDNLKLTLATMQSNLHIEVEKLWSMFAEFQMDAAGATRPDAELKDRLSRLETGHQDLTKLGARLKKDHLALRRAADEQKPQLGAASKALICLTSDVDMMDARLSSQISELEAGLERNGRQLQGLAVGIGRQPVSPRSSLARSEPDITNKDTVSMAQAA